MIFKLASNITVKTFEFHYFNKFAKKSNQHQQKTEGILSLALIVHPVKDKRKEKARMVTRCCCCCCCCCWGHPGPSQVACWAQGSLSSGGCMRVCACEFSLEPALRERMTVSQPEVPPALRCGSSWPGGRWAFVTCWWKERESDQESPHVACSPHWLGPWLLVCFCVLLLHLKIYIIYCIYYLLGCLGAHLWQVGSSSMTSDPTWGPLPWKHRVLAPGPPGKSLFAHFNLRITSSEEISIYLPIRREHKGNGFRVCSEWQVKA